MTYSNEMSNQDGLSNSYSLKFKCSLSLKEAEERYARFPVARMHRVGSPDFFEYNRITRRWDKRSMPALTDGEKAVITLSIQGYTMTEIGDKMCLSPETINKYRKQVFEKLGVRNITEAIIAATNNKLL